MLWSSFDSEWWIWCKRVNRVGHSRRSVAQNNRSAWLKRGRLVCRSKTINYYLKATISSPGHVETERSFSAA
jgi:hypothetical protein